MLPAGLTTLIQLLREQWQHMAGVEMGTGLLLQATISIKITFSAISHCIFKVQTFDTVLPPAPQSTQPCNVPPCSSLVTSSGLADLSESNLGKK